MHDMRKISDLNYPETKRGFVKVCSMLTCTAVC